MSGRLASVLMLAAALAACREPMSDGRDRGPLDEVAARGGRAFSAVTGRDGGYRDDAPGGDYLRGVRDGLDDVDFNRDERSEAYARGYEAGRRERRRDRQRYEVTDGPRDDRYAERRPYARPVDRVRPVERPIERTDDYRTADAGPDDYRRAGFAANGPPRSAPREAMRACADEVERMFDLPSGSAAAVTSRPRDNGGFQVGVRAGQRQANCILSADGEVRSVDER